ncbi:hypothetical protein GBAR_LOCUS25522 [Geodia barretti]|uniref:Uncharacterized protein n=1 Tax=Geodia barretti TaxID=519541 RepID=A0AA35XCW0_GEOBA|nr:hypothetical protein GBAR_LOCUS25522 [Geodia barretti]
MELFQVFLLYGLISVAQGQSSENVPLGNNVTLNCTYERGIQWEIIGSGNTSLNIYLDYVPPEAIERGIVPVPHQKAGDANVNRLKVLGSLENNQTQIKCTESGNGSVTIASYILTVIGPPERPGEVRGWVVEFSPLRLRLEWEEPFSHTDHPVLHYTLYTRDGGALFTANTSSVTFGLQDVEFSSNCIRSADGIGVAAVSDIGESELSPIESIWRDVDDKHFSVIEGKLFSQNELSILELLIKFPQLCEGQEMRYRVEVEEERTGRLVYQDTRVSEYRGGDVDYSNTTSSLLDHGYYTALVFLHTGGQNISSFPFRLLNSGGTKETSEKESSGIGAQENDSKTGDVLLSVIVVLTALVICFLVAAVVVGAILVKNKFFSTTREVKESGNPIYEGPLYENMEESPGTSLPPPPPSARRRGSVSRSVDNVYHSSPVPIPTGPETEGLYAELLAAKKQESQTRAPGG